MHTIFPALCSFSDLKNISLRAYHPLTLFVLPHDSPPHIPRGHAQQQKRSLGSTDFHFQLKSSDTIEIGLSDRAKPVIESRMIMLDKTKYLRSSMQSK